MSIYQRIRSFYYALLMVKKHHYLSTLIRKGLHLGRDVEIIDDFFFDPSHCFLISIGDNCIICPNVRLIAHDASTKKFLGYTKIGRIVIHDRCFLGDSVLVLPNVVIGPDTIVGAGSVVTHDLPPGTVAAGNPARVISTLEDYLEKARALEHEKGVFGEDYLIHRIDAARRQQVLESVKKSVGFIV